MIPRPRTIVLTFLGFVAWAAVALWVVATNSMLKSDAPEAVRHVPHVRAPAVAPARDAARDAGGGLLGGLWGLVKLPLGLALAAALAVVAVRLVGRRREARVRVRLLPHRDETLAPQAVDGLLRAWHAVLQEAPLRAAVLGPPSVGLEVETGPGPQGAAVAALALVAPAHLVPALESALHERCPDLRLVTAPAAPATTPVSMRLRRPRRPMGGSRADAGDRLLAVLDAMAATGAPVRVQYALAAARTPAGGRRAPDVAWSASDPAAPFEPTRAVALPDGPAPAQPLPVAYHLEIRVAGPTSAACAGVAEAAAAAVGLSATGLTGLRGGMATALWRRPRATSSSAELAGGWHLPTAERGAPTVPRTSVPRLPAPARVSRGADDALLRDEDGPVGLAADARRGGLAIIGGADAARGALVARWLERRAAGDDAVPVVALVARPGGAAAIRALLEPERDVVAIDLAEPSVGVNPLAAAQEPDEIGAAVAAALGRPDDRLLRLTLAATVAAGRAGLLDGPPAPAEALRLLNPVEDGLREAVARDLYRAPRGADLASFVGHELRALLHDDAADAAREALRGRRGWTLDVLARAPRTVTLSDVLRRRQVLVVDAGALDAADRGPLARLTLTGLAAALREIAPPGRSASERMALLIDGAEDVVDGTLADELFALRDAGLALAATWRCRGGLADPDARARLLRPTAHRCAFAPADGDAPAVALAVCEDLLAADDRLPARSALSARGAVGLAEGYALCSWALDGGRATFVGRALPAAAPVAD